jgi:hypothetical protein
VESLLAKAGGWHLLLRPPWFAGPVCLCRSITSEKSVVIATKAHGSQVFARDCVPAWLLRSARAAGEAARLLLSQQAGRDLTAAGTQTT